MKVEIITRLTVPHENGNRVFIHPAFRGDVPDLRAQLAQAKLDFPTMPELGSLLYDSYVVDNFKNKYAKEVQYLMKEWIGYADTATLWTKKGLWAYDGAVSENLRLVESGLQDLLKREDRGVSFSEDGRIRFTPHENIKIREQTSKQLANNSGLVVVAGSFEQAGKLAKVSEELSYNPLFGILRKENIGEEPIQRIVGAHSWCGNRLYVDGSYHGSDVGGFAFGVDKSAEGTCDA